MKIFRHLFRVPFHELGPHGILFHAHLFTHAHQAYEMLMKDLGFGLADLLREGRLSIPLAQARAEYFKPLRLDEQVQIEIQTITIGKHSFQLGYRFLRSQELCATACTIHILRDRLLEQNIPLPMSLRTGLAAYLED